jgi:hypothetical protein
VRLDVVLRRALARPIVVDLMIGVGVVVAIAVGLRDDDGSGGPARSVRPVPTTTAPSPTAADLLPRTTKRADAPPIILVSPDPDLLDREAARRRRFGEWCLDHRAVCRDLVGSRDGVGLAEAADAWCREEPGDCVRILGGALGV